MCVCLLVCVRAGVLSGDYPVHADLFCRVPAGAVQRAHGCELCVSAHTELVRLAMFWSVVLCS